MKLSTGNSLKYLKASEVKEGDVITFLDEGQWIESTKYTYPDGNPKRALVFSVTYKGEKHNVRCNKYSQEELIKSYGPDTSDWVNHEARIVIEYVRSLQTNMIILIPTSVPADEEIPEPETPDTAWDEGET